MTDVKKGSSKTPGKNERVETVVATVRKGLSAASSLPPQVPSTIAQIKKRIDALGFTATCILGGSFAKGVWLDEGSDVDLFVQFDKEKYVSKELSNHLEKILEPFSPVRLHGSRDYFHITVEGRLFEVVPVLLIDNACDAQNVTDASPLHSIWVQENVHGLQNDIRLAKLFCKSARVYGAESFRRGFSGHVLDILIIHYGGFVPFIQAVKTWSGQVVLDPMKAYKRRPLFYLNEAKIQGPLVVVDPVDATRNAAAAVDGDAVSRLQEHIAGFLKSPSVSFFETQPIPSAPMKYEILFFAQPLSGKTDIVGAKMRKAYEYATRVLSSHLPVTHTDWWWTGEECESVWLIRVKHFELPSVLQVRGPPADLEPHAAAFRKEHKVVRVVDGVLVAEEPYPVASLQVVLDTICAHVVEKKWVASARYEGV